MEERFGVAAFRSRQHVTAFEQLLRRAGVPVSIVSTPRSIALGCGLSVRFRLEDARRVQEIFRQSDVGNLIGFYQVRYGESGRAEAYPIGTDMGYRG